MASFVSTIRPTSFGFFDSDPAFQRDADSMITFVKRKLGDDILSVELTNRQIWNALEEATVNYGSIVNTFQIRNQLLNLLGTPTGSQHDISNLYLHQTLDFLSRMAQPYIGMAGLGGDFDSDMVYIPVVPGQQDYDLYATLLIGSGSMSGSNYFQNLPSGSHSKLKVFEVFHFEPFAAQTLLLNASNVTNFLANEFNYESYVNSTVFYVLPIFEDVLRRGMLKAAARVRRSNYSYEIKGKNLRIYPIPTTDAVTPRKIWLRVSTNDNPTQPNYQDDTIYGVSSFSNAPFQNIPYGTINDVGRWWIREFAFAICMEVLGRVRSKFKSVPIPNAEVTLDGDTLLSDAKDKQDKLNTQIREDLEKLTLPALMAQEAEKADAMTKLLRLIPMPLGKAIIIG